MITCLSPLESEHKRGFFQRQNADKVILGVSLFSCVGCILSVSCKSADGGILG